MLKPIIYRFYGDDGHYRDVFEEALKLGVRGYTECDEIIGEDAIFYIFHISAYTEDGLKELIEQYEKEGKMNG